MLALLGLLLALPVNHSAIVTPEWLSQHLNDRSVIVVEVGDEEDYDRGHIPGARLLDRDDFIVWAEGLPDELPSVERLEKVFTRLGIGERGRIVLYSREPLLATRAWFTLDVVGQGHRTSILDGGWDAWNGRALPVATMRQPWKSREFSARVNPFVVASPPWMRAVVRARNHLRYPLRLIDARPVSEYLGVYPGRDIERPGHIAGAACVPWSSNLKPDGTLRPAHELRRMYSQLGVREQTTIITYCRTGLEASMSYFVLRYLGYEVSLYDGSWYDWSRNGQSAVFATALQ